MEREDDVVCENCEGTLDSAARRKYTPEKEHALRAQAVSLQHLLTHLPKNPFCEACLRSKLNKVPARKIAKVAEEQPTSFGEKVTCDHLISKDGRNRW